MLWYTRAILCRKWTGQTRSKNLMLRSEAIGNYIRYFVLADHRSVLHKTYIMNPQNHHRLAVDDDSEAETNAYGTWFTIFKDGLLIKAAMSDAC